MTTPDPKATTPSEAALACARKIVPPRDDALWVFDVENVALIIHAHFPATMNEDHHQPDHREYPPTHTDSTTSPTPQAEGTGTPNKPPEGKYTKALRYLLGENTKPNPPMVSEELAAANKLAADRLAWGNEVHRQFVQETNRTSDLSAQLTEANALLAQQTAVIETAKVEVTRLSALLTDTVRRGVALEATIAQLNAEIIEHHIVGQKTLKNIQGLEATIAGLERTYSETANALIDANAESVRLAGEVERLKGEVENWRTNCNEVAIERNRAQHQVAALEVRLAAAEKDGEGVAFALEEAIRMADWRPNAWINVLAQYRARPSAATEGKEEGK